MRFNSWSICAHVQQTFVDLLQLQKHISKLKLTKGLTGWWFERTPLKKYEFVNCDDRNPILMGKLKIDGNQTTNQINLNYPSLGMVLLLVKSPDFSTCSTASAKGPSMAGFVLPSWGSEASVSCYGVPQK